MDGRSQLDEHGDVVMLTEVVQLEGPPLPFPAPLRDALTGWLDSTEGWTP